MYRLEYRNTFGRVKLCVNSWNNGKVWYFLIAEDASVGIATRNILYLKIRHVRVLELAAKEHNFINSSLVLFSWLVRARELTFINMEVILNALGRKEVIYSLDMWCTVSSSVGECSLWCLVSTGKREILLSPWLEVMVNLSVLSLWREKLTSVERSLLGHIVPWPPSARRKQDQITERNQKVGGVERGKIQKR